VIGGATGIGFAVAAPSRELGAEIVIASSNEAEVEAALECLRNDGPYRRSSKGRGTNGSHYGELAASSPRRNRRSQKIRVRRD
jgi:NAD(P)-dependent dehydrogenase (short-subunit alcohol dehydrogenase family)